MHRRSSSIQRASRACGVIADVNPSCVYACDAGWEKPLAAELARADSRAQPASPQPGWVHCASPADGNPVAFARQCLPSPMALSAESINAWASAAWDAAADALIAHRGAWRLHVFSVPIAGGNAGPRRCQLIWRAFLDVVRRRQRRLIKLLTLHDATAFAENEALLQVGLRTASEGYVSLALPAARGSLRRVLSRFAGGVVDISADGRAPSQALAKLQEVEIRANHPIQPGERCVDLGASPGGWSWLALQRGAQVVAVDRAPLRADLMRHPNLEFLRGDAFAYQPDRPVDWLLCDVIAFPHKQVELLSRWLEHAWCRNFCVTIKFRGRGDDAQLEPLKALLARHAPEACLRRLSANKNEVTAYGAAGVGAGAANFAASC